MKLAIMLCSDAIISVNYLSLKRLVAGLSMQKAQEKLRTARACKTVVACENSPHNVTVSGKAKDTLNQHIGKAGIPANMCHPVVWKSLIQYIFCQRKAFQCACGDYAITRYGTERFICRGLRDSRQKKTRADIVVRIAVQDLRMRFMASSTP